MSIEEKLRLFVHLDSLIKHHVKGNSIIYAQRLGISRASFFRLIDYLKNTLNVPVCYSPEHYCYEYTKKAGSTLASWLTLLTTKRKIQRAVVH